MKKCLRQSGFSDVTNGLTVIRGFIKNIFLVAKCHKKGSLLANPVRQHRVLIKKKKKANLSSLKIALSVVLTSGLT